MGARFEVSRGCSCPSLCLSFCLFIHLSMSLFVCLFVSLFSFLFPFCITLNRYEYFPLLSNSHLTATTYQFPRKVPSHSSRQREMHIKQPESKGVTMSRASPSTGISHVHPERPLCACHSPLALRPASVCPNAGIASISITQKDMHVMNALSAEAQRGGRC